MIVKSGLVLLVALSMAIGGCSSHESPARVGTCLEASTTGASSAPAAHRVPDVRLACFDGSGSVRLDGLDRPAVVSLWASWCRPCRAELPVVEAFAQSAGGRVAVIGVDTGDTRTGGSSMVADLGLGYPMLFDPDFLLSHAVGRNVLPVTLFVKPGGTLAYVYSDSEPLDRHKLADLTEQYLGVRVDG